MFAQAVCHTKKAVCFLFFLFGRRGKKEVPLIRGSAGLVDSQLVLFADGSFGT